jgi:hypothetical protein
VQHGDVVADPKVGVGAVFVLARDQNETLVFLTALLAQKAMKA